MIVEYCPHCEEWVRLENKNNRMECPQCDYTDDDTLLPLAIEEKDE